MSKPEEYGLTKDEADKVKDIPPTINLGQVEIGNRKEMKILEDKPREIEHTDPQTGEPKTSLAITVLDLDTQVESTLWLSSKTVRTGLFNVSEKHESLKGVTIAITPEEKEMKKFGKTRLYRVAEKQEQEKEDE